MGGGAVFKDFHLNSTLTSNMFIAEISNGSVNLNLMPEGNITLLSGLRALVQILLNQVGQAIPKCNQVK